MNRLRIAILGTRGIPNQYGGFEQAAEQISTGLVNKGHEVTVYNSHRHHFRDSIYKGVQIVHGFDPEFLLGTAGQFIYDLNCIRDAAKRNFDIILFLGYTSSSVWWRFFPKKTIVSNMDGLEWKRTKYNVAIRKFLKLAERLAAMHSHFLVADSIGIRQYLQEHYNKQSEFIPYGAVPDLEEDLYALREMKLKPQQYYMLMARLEPENNIEMILDGFVSAISEKTFIVVGNHMNGFGRKMKKKFGREKRIQFVGAIYEQHKVHTLRKHAALYFHGHSVGGTNPSLLEAMASKAIIAAHDNIFNRGVLGEDAFYFSGSNNIADLIASPLPGDLTELMKKNNHRKILEQYNWQVVVDQYENFLDNCFQKNIHEATIRDKRYAVK